MSGKTSAFYSLPKIFSVNPTIESKSMNSIKLATILGMGGIALFGAFGAVSAQTVTVKKQLTIYEKPHPRSRVVKILPPGSRIKFLGSRAGWDRIAWAAGKTGWINLKLPSKASRPVVQKSTHTHRHGEPDRKPANRRRPPSRLMRTGTFFGMGAMNFDFSYAFRFFHGNWPRTWMEGSFQFVADKVVSVYLMDMSFRRVWLRTRHFDAWYSAGMGVMTSVPVKAADQRSISNLAFNFGIGGQKALDRKRAVRVDFRNFYALKSGGIAAFWDVSVGLVFRIR